MEEERFRIYMTVDMDIVYLAENIQYYAINRELMEIEHIIIQVSAFPRISGEGYL